MTLIVLTGNPNAGKTTLFNALTGLSARVGNYPGITVEHREGKLNVGGRAARVLDLPGTYSLIPRADDEGVAVRGVFGLLPSTPPADVLVCVVDATALERNLQLVAQLRELPVPLVVALTMTDVLKRDGRSLDVGKLQAQIGVPVVEAAGLRALLEQLVAHPARRSPMNPPEVRLRDRQAVVDVGGAVAAALQGPSLPLQGSPLALGLWALSLRAGKAVERVALPAAAERAVRGLPVDDATAAALVAARYRRAADWAKGVVGNAAGDAEPPSARVTRRIDAVALHPVLGPVLLVGVFLALFQALFTWSTPLMDGIEAVIGWAGEHVGPLVPESLPLLRSLVVNGVIAGVGNVVVFVPQIAVLFLFLSLLEDSGYLARAAFLLDRLMARVGLHGRAFVPLLSGFACAVPAIMATRTIESNKDRIVTILVTPLVSCSARLPVYALMIATVFSTMPPLFGVLAPGAVVMVSMYGLSLVAAVGMAAIFKRTILKSPTPPLVLELPPYRLPNAGQVARQVFSRVRLFLVEAGTVILAITVVLWGLFTFPRSDEIEGLRAASRAQVEATVTGEAKDAELARVDATAAQAQLEQSIAGRAGKLIEPVIAPLGFDWKIGVGLIASFAAREVLVSTLGLVYGLGDGTDEESTSLREALRNDRRPDGTPVYTPLTALSLLVFFVLAMQCMSTLAATRRETGGWRWPAVQLGYMTGLAYLASLLVYQVGRLFL